MHLECSDDLVAQFHKSMKEEVWQVNVLLSVSAILAGIVVGIGSYVHRYRYHGFARYLYLGATTMLLSIISVLLSANSSTSTYRHFNASILGELTGVDTVVAHCITNRNYLYMVLLCACLVLLSAINTRVIVAGDEREARGIISPPFELLVQGIWALYLVLSGKVRDGWLTLSNNVYFQWAPFALIYAKMTYRYYAFQRARRSLALGRNPRLIVGYMKQLQEAGGSESEPPPAADGHNDQENVVPPPLVVMGEEGPQVQKQPHGYYLFNRDDLVTIDKVWRSDNKLVVSMPQLKGICLSFALFKLLRCRFARYKPITTDAFSMETLDTLRRVLLKDERAFGVVADELSFLHDYYYSSLPISYSACWLPILSISISLLNIVFCILAGMSLMSDVLSPASPKFQMLCYSWCTRGGWSRSDYNPIYSVGNLYFELVPVLLLFALVVLSEAWEIASFLCSNWTKVALTCRSMNHTGLQKNWIVGLLLRSRCNLLKHWNGKMSQCSLLVQLRPRKALLLLHLLLRRLIPLPDQKSKPIEVPLAVKVCIINALRSSCKNNEGLLSKGVRSLRRQSQVGERFIWACKSQGTSDKILVWHIATSILEVRHPHQQPQGRHGSSSVSDNKTAATHLSRYCAYLVAFCPDLLPDDDKWSKDLYKDVKKEARRALTGGIAVSTPEAECRLLLEKLQSAESEHDVLTPLPLLVLTPLPLPLHCGVVGIVDRPNDTY